MASTSNRCYAHGLLLRVYSGALLCHSIGVSAVSPAHMICVNSAVNSRAARRYRDGNERKQTEKPISTSISILFGENGSGFEKYGFKNEIGICRYTETDKYGWRAKKLN
jgi:hypothetical protein